MTAHGSGPARLMQVDLPGVPLLGVETIPREALVWLGRRLGLIGHPDRLHILLLLQKHRELCVCQIIARTGLPQPRVSQLLQQLRAGRLVEGRRAGQKMLYSLAKDALLTELMGSMGRLRVKGTDNKSPA